MKAHARTQRLVVLSSETLARRARRFLDSVPVASRFYWSRGPLRVDLTGSLKGCVPVLGSD